MNIKLFWTPPALRSACKITAFLPILHHLSVKGEPPAGIAFERFSVYCDGTGTPLMKIKCIYQFDVRAVDVNVQYVCRRNTTR